MIKSWIFEFFATPAELAEGFDPAESQSYFNAYLDLWASAEPADFDGIFFSEHHFGASYSPCAPRRSGSASWESYRPTIRRGSWSRRSKCSITSPAAGWRSAPLRAFRRKWLRSVSASTLRARY
jgi:hypothetical protein